jgi:glyoxylase-like metal-dependent hydrolase (beta-lactamase superfamily II)
MEKSVYEVIQIDEKSWRIEENGVRSLLFAGTEKALLVDTGFGSGNIREVVESLTKLPVMLVNTHADGDHLGCNKLFDKADMHPAEFDRYHQKMGYEFTAEPLWHGHIIDLGGRRFEFKLIPGHTPGSIVLLDEENKILIGGDSVQMGAIYMFGAGRNIHAYIHSMKKLDMLKNFDTVYPSHGPFPVDAGIIGELISGAEQIRDGKIKGTSAGDRPADLYEIGRVKFLYR